MRALFAAVPAAHARRVHDRLEPGAPKDDFATYLKQQFPVTRVVALAELRTKFAPAPEAPRAAPQVRWVPDDPAYADNAFRSMGIPIWGGDFVFSRKETFQVADKDNVSVPRSLIHVGTDPLAGKTVVYLDKVHDSATAARAEAVTFTRPGFTGVGFYRVAGVIVPTVISDTTAPSMTRVARAAIAAEGDDAEAAKKLGWALLWWYIGARFPVRGGKPPVSPVSTVLGEAAYARHLAAVQPLRLLHPKLAKLTVDELVAIRAYSGNGALYKSVNFALRGWEKGTDAATVVSRTALAGLRKLPGHTGRVYRSFPSTGGEIRNVVARYREGVTVTEQGFTSTTARAGGLPQMKGNVSMVIEASGKLGKDIRLVTEVAEDEVLFLPGVRFLVKKVYQSGDAIGITLVEL